MKTIRTAKESRLNYTANGIKGKNGEIISTFGELSYLPAYYDFDPVRLEIRLTVKDYKELHIIPHGCNIRNDSDYMTDYYDKDRLTIPATAGKLADAQRIWGRICELCEIAQELGTLNEQEYSAHIKQAEYCFYDNL